MRIKYFCIFFFDNTPFFSYICAYNYALFTLIPEAEGVKMQTMRTFRLGEQPPRSFFIKYINMKPTITRTIPRAITHNVLCIAICACIVSAFISACAFVPTASNFPRDKVRLGMNTKEVRGIMGKPFSEDTFLEGEKRVDVLHYKEAVRVKTQGFILTTSLRFENDSLTAITQNEKMVDEVTRESKVQQ